MLDTTPVTTAIKELISAGVAKDELGAHVLREFPHLTVAELSQALQQVGPTLRMGLLARGRALLRR